MSFHEYITSIDEAKKKDTEREEQLRMGKIVEKEHKNIWKILYDKFKNDLPFTEDEFYTLIAQAHIDELKDYYTRLKKMESGAEKESEFDNEKEETLKKESVQIDEKEKESYEDQIKRQLSKAKKEKNAEKVVYYNQAFGKSAVVDFDKFKGAWAYEDWKNKNKNEIEKVEKEFKRFNYMENTNLNKESSMSILNEMEDAIKKQRSKMIGEDESEGFEIDPEDEGDAYVVNKSGIKCCSVRFVNKKTENFDDMNDALENPEEYKVEIYDVKNEPEAKVFMKKMEDNGFDGDDVDFVESVEVEGFGDEMDDYKKEKQAKKMTTDVKKVDADEEIRKGK